MFNITRGSHSEDPQNSMDPGFYYCVIKNVKSTLITVVNYIKTVSVNKKPFSIYRKPMSTPSGQLDAMQLIVALSSALL